jgi:hypothetical protein
MWAVECARYANDRDYWKARAITAEKELQEIKSKKPE